MYILHRRLFRLNGKSPLNQIHVTLLIMSNVVFRIDQISVGIDGTIAGLADKVDRLNVANIGYMFYYCITMG